MPSALRPLGGARHLDGYVLGASDGAAPRLGCESPEGGAGGQVSPRLGELANEVVTDFGEGFV